MLQLPKNDRLRVLHVPFTYPPDAIGGTEVYVRALVRDLNLFGLTPIIAAPGQCSEVYEIDGFPVHRFAVQPHISLDEQYGAGDASAANAFQQIIDTVSPELVHIHAFTPAVSIQLVRRAKQRGLPVIFTYHTPTVSCPRGTLLRWGTVDCDGALKAVRCARCVLHGAGVDKASAFLLGGLPTSFGKVLARWNLTGGVWTGLRMPDLICRRQAAVRELIVLVDHIVAPSAWVKDLLLANGAKPDKISLVRQGQAFGSKAQFLTSRSRSRSENTLRIAFLGRVDPTKGIDVLLAALSSLPQANASLDIFGIVQERTSYTKTVTRLASTDRRVRFLQPVAADRVIGTLTAYDVLAVPSRLKETGPFVVLDAFAAGIPVIGSNLGGIAERIRHGVDGLLVEPGSVSAWADAILQLAKQPNLLSKLRDGIQAPRTMHDVANDMLDIYARVCHCPKTQANALL